MKSAPDATKVFSRRAFIIGFLQAGFLAMLGARLAWLQVAQGARYKTLSDKNRINIKLLAPSRGQVFDRFGNMLAVNEQSFRLSIVPEQAGDLVAVLKGLQNIIPIIEDSDVERVANIAKRQAKFLPIEVRGGLDWSDVAKVEVNLPDLPGLSIDSGETRRYPYGMSTAHILGYVSSVSRVELERNPLLSLPGFKTGKTGVEKYYDLALRGNTGSSEVEVNAVGREVRELNHNQAINGAELVLNLDIRLQEFIQQRLSKERSASAVVMDSLTGAVYGLVSSPSFDPNAFTKGLSASQWEELLANPGKPLNNKSLTGQYPPASTFKMITALAALEDGVITRNTRKYCPGHFDLGGHRFHCWKAGGHGSVDLTKALAVSCDTFFYEVAVDVGIEKISKMAKNFGLGVEPDMDISELRSGLMPNKDWKMGHFGESWKIGETVVASIGQGYILTTPMQLAVMTARLVNGGKLVQPRIASQVGSENMMASQWPKIKVAQQHLDLITKGMDKAVNDAKGTAYKARIESNAFKMGGKTGTAQVKRITLAQRRAGFEHDDLPWEHRHHALFVGFAPVGNPRYVCSVVVEHGGGGSEVAAPIARDILKKAQELNSAGNAIA